MTQIISNTGSAILVAIDIGKFKHQILIEYPNKSVKSLKINNAHEDYQKLLAMIKSDQFPTIAGFEATGDYHRCIAYFLQKNGVTCHLISSVATARIRDARYNSWDKNDPKDAQVIMHLLKADFIQKYYDPLIHGTNDIQELSNTYHQVSKRKTRLLHSLKNHYLTLYFPEAEKYLHSTRANWLLNLLLDFPCPESIRRLTCDEFVLQASSVEGRKVNKINWLRDFYYTACSSIGLPILPGSETEQMLCAILREYRHATDIRDMIEKRTIDTLSGNCDFIRLQTIPGIGPIIALTILAEAGDLRRFRHYRQFIKFCGFDLSTQRSGTFQGQTKLSKRGNARLRQALWMAAQVAVLQKENSFRNKFKTYIDKHPDNADHKRKSYTNIAIKMARVAHALIKSNTDYRGYHECH